MNDQTSGPLDLDLLAHDYVLGQLDASAEATWEERLTHDQDAREAVVRAMRIADALVREAPKAVPVETSRWQRVKRPLIAAAAAAAFVVIALAIKLRSRDDVERTAQGPSSASDDAELLLASWLEFDVADVEADDWNQEPNDLDASEAIETPGWLMSALDTTTDPEEQK